MTDLLRFLNTNEVWIYLLLGVVGIYYLRKIVLSIQDWQGAVFGLEKNLAIRRLSEAASIFFLLLLLGSGEFFLVSFVSPAYPGLHPNPTPTLDLLSTETPAPLTGATTQVAVGSQTVVGPTQALTSDSKYCIPGQVEFTEPKSGDKVQGKITIHGTVMVPNLGYYKYEFEPANDSNRQGWTTVQAGDQVRCPPSICQKSTAVPGTPTAVPSDTLGDWDTSLLAPGNYLLRLVVYDNQGTSMPACQISVNVVPPE